MNIVETMNETSRPAEQGSAAVSARALMRAFWIAAVAVGAVYTWRDRHVIDPDGISYIEIGKAYFRHDWANAINAYWSPLYSWFAGLALHLTAPSPERELPVIHAVNFAIFLVVCGCFAFFIREWLRARELRAEALVSEGVFPLPVEAWVGFAAALFFWAVFRLIDLASIGPDLCVLGVVLLASGIVVKMQSSRPGFVWFVLLGAVLAIGYYAKAVMFPLGLVFLAVAAFTGRERRRAIVGTALALVVFAGLISPFVALLSERAGKLTTGTAGQLNYAWYVNGATMNVHWQGGPPGNGIAAHPTRKINDWPAVYEFGEPVTGTYPPWRDPSYWNEGLKPHFNFRQQLHTWILNARHLATLLFRDLELLPFFLLMGALSYRKRIGIREVASGYLLWVPAVLGIFAYLTINLEGRYIAAFLILLSMCLMSGILMPSAESAQRLARAIAMTYTVIIVMLIILPFLRPAGLHDARQDYRMAESLHEMGVTPGTPVATIGYNVEVYWAYFAGLRVVAEVPQTITEVGCSTRNCVDDDLAFWSADEKVQSQVLNAFARTSARAVIGTPPGFVHVSKAWQPIPGSDAFILWLPPAKQSGAAGTQ